MNKLFRGLDRRLRPAAQALYDIAVRAGARPTLTSVYRSPTKQARIYRAAQRGESRYPAAPPGHSTHEQHLAFDMPVRDAGIQRQLGELWESIGGTWGGRFKDPIHFDARVLSRKSRR